MSLTTDQLFVLNDRMTMVLSELGWVAANEADYDLLNEQVHSIADAFFGGFDPVSGDVLEVVERLVDYNWQSEERDYESPEWDRGHGHIFEDLMFLRSWISAQRKEG